MILGKPLFTSEVIAEKIGYLAGVISRDYAGRDILAIGILKGSFIFFSDLVRAINVPLTIDFVIASSYVKTTSTGEVKVHYDPREDIAGRDVLLVDDIIDTGISLNYVRDRLLSMRPASLKTCVFLDKKERRIVGVPVDYVGFEIPNEFVVGYGLDFENQYRNLPYISVFKKKI